MAARRRTVRPTRSQATRNPITKSVCLKTNLLSVWASIAAIQVSSASPALAILSAKNSSKVSPTGSATASNKATALWL
jgi:hypothetical protein